MALSRNSISPGGGIYKSTDGGRSWTFLGLAETRTIARIQLGHGVGEVKLDGLGEAMQKRCDFGGGFATRRPRQALQLARRERSLRITALLLPIVQTIDQSHERVRDQVH